MKHLTQIVGQNERVIADLVTDKKPLIQQGYGSDNGHLSLLVGAELVELYLGRNQLSGESEQLQVNQQPIEQEPNNG